MKFLTREWAGGGISDDAREVREEWRQHQQAPLPQLPANVRRFAERLATDLTIHDGFVRRADVDLRRHHVEIVLRCFSGAKFEHQLDLTLRFGGVERLSPGGAEFARFLALPDVEWLYHELDLAPDDAVDFRLLHWRPSTKHAEHELRFRHLTFAIVPVADAAQSSVGDERPTVRLDGHALV